MAVTDNEANPRAIAPGQPAPRPVGRFARVRSWFSVVGLGYLAASAVFAVGGLMMTTDPVNGGGVAAALLSLLITLPVLLARPAPTTAAFAQAAGLLINELVFGPMIRCGFVVPAMLVIVFAVGAADSPTHRTSRWWGLAACVATSTMLLAWDPALDSSVIFFLGGLLAGFFLAGTVIRSRTNLVKTLQRRTAELEAQRDRTAALEVAADRARVGADLERLIRAQITAIGASATQAQTVADDDPVGARAALIDVENSGRATLAQMREVVGDLREVPTEPSPGLDQLAELLRRATSADTRLNVHGRVRPLTRSLELSAYRIVEQLLTTLRNRPQARVEVDIRVTADTLEIRVCGPAVAEQETTAGFESRFAAAAEIDRDRALTAVRARAELHGGVVLIRKPLGRIETEVRLPLATIAPR